MRRVAGLFETANAVEMRYRKALAYTTQLMGAAIAKAFRGEFLVGPGIPRSQAHEAE